MGGITLRDYQEQAVSEIREGLAKYRRIVCVLPTGGGKGLILGYVTSLAVKKGSKVLILAHREEVMKQDANQCRKFGVEPEIISPKHRKVPTSNCAVGMIQTMRRRIEKPEWQEYLKSVTLLVPDEAHVCDFDFIFDYISPKCYVTGYTATPSRSGHMKQMALMYNAMVVGPSVQDLVDMGYLCRCKLYSLDAPSMDDVEWDYGRGDYNLGQMAAKFKSRTKYVGAVENYLRICPGEKAIVFGCSSEQCIGLAEEFNAHGVSAKYLLSNNFDEDEDYSGPRKEIVDGFARGDFKVLVNLGIGTTGLDIADIKVVMVLFATTSIVKWYQCLGRASRIAEGKNNEFICLDFGCNFEKIGRYEQPRQWSLWHSEGKGGGVPPMKICPQCQKMIPVQYSDCPYCNYHFPSQQEIYHADLQEIVANETEEETIEQYVAKRKLEGKKTNWILVNVCIKNPEHQKEAFMRAIEVLRTTHGESISPKYWFFFRKNILDKVKVKKSEDSSPKLF